jgi:outer membrane protein
MWRPLRGSRSKFGSRLTAFGALTPFACVLLLEFARTVAAQDAGVPRLEIGSQAASTLPGALVLAYRNNPQLNAQRAATRSIDENVPTALSGYKPKVSATASLTEQYLDNVTKTVGPAGPPLYTQQKGGVAVSNAGMTATQTLYNGFQTGNRTRQAEGQVYAARETLRNTEQTVLLNGATAYMNLLRDAAVLEVQRSNVNVLEVTLRQTRDRFAAGEVTRTDVAQAESSLAAGRAQLATAESNYVTSRANFRQVIGVEPPARLAPGAPVDRFFPRTLPGAKERGAAQHPSITTSMYNVDVALFQVKIAEGALYPTVSAVGNVQKQYGSTASLAILETVSASLGAQMSVPLYQGGAEYAAIRQSKEILGQRRLDLDTARLQVEAAIVQSWGQLESAKAQINATQAQVTAAEVALNGVREEARVGQRTTLDVLNAQLALVNARVSLVTAQHDRVVASYSVLANVGSLSPQVLGLNTEVYDPMVHYQQVRDAWVGVRIPDGR